MIHGDGYNHIERLDTRREIQEDMDETFDLVITNPPFDLPYEAKKHKELLKGFDLGRGRTSQGPSSSVGNAQPRAEAVP